MANYTTNELMAVCAAMRLKDGMNVAVGLGLPQMACFLAKATHAPDMNMFYELGVYNPVPKDTGLDLADPRIWYDADYYTGFVGALGEILHGGHVDVGFLGALQVDQDGNLNSTLINKPNGRFSHYTGSGGAADIANLSKNVFIILKHEARKVVEKLDYLTSVGCYKGGHMRTEKGIPPATGVTVFTNLCIMQTGAESGRLELRSLHPGVTLDTLKENTGFDLIIPSDYEITPEPDPEYLRVLREVIDPRKIYIK
jgi:glutaconate CoA-transferase subunit B